MKATCLLLGLSGAVILAGCNKSDSAVAPAPSAGGTLPAHRSGAREATAVLGGKAEVVPGLGDEALFGAISTLYLRKRGALAVIGASSKKQGTSYESDARAMAVALATKLLEKI